MKVYLDTNMLYFLLLKNNEDISPAVNSILSDYQTVLCTSAVCVHELIHLCHIGKVPVGKKKSALKKAHDVLTWLNDMNIEIVAVTEKHLQEYADLPFYDDHKDPNDRLIIGQAISDKVLLVSSDHKFERYVKYGLNFIFNKR